MYVRDNIVLYEKSCNSKEKCNNWGTKKKQKKKKTPSKIIRLYSERCMFTIFILIYKFKYYSVTLRSTYQSLNLKESQIRFKKIQIQVKLISWPTIQIDLIQKIYHNQIKVTFYHGQIKNTSNLLCTFSWHGIKPNFSIKTCHIHVHAWYIQEQRSNIQI